MPIGEPENRHGLFPPEWTAQAQFVANPQLPMRLAALTVDLDLSPLACLLGFGSRPVQTGDVEPDIEPDRLVHLFTMLLSPHVPYALQLASSYKCRKPRHLFGDVRGNRTEVLATVASKVVITGLALAMQTAGSLS